MLSANNSAHTKIYGDREAQLPAHAPKNHSKNPAIRRHLIIERHASAETLIRINADTSRQNWVRLTRHRQGQAGLAQIKSSSAFSDSLPDRITIPANVLFGSITVRRFNLSNGQYLLQHNEPRVRSEQLRLECNSGRALDPCKEKREATSPREQAKGRERSSSFGLRGWSTSSSGPVESTDSSLGAVKT